MLEDMLCQNAALKQEHAELLARSPVPPAQPPVPADAETQNALATALHDNQMAQFGMRQLRDELRFAKRRAEHAEEALMQERSRMDAQIKTATHQLALLGLDDVDAYREHASQRLRPKPLQPQPTAGAIPSSAAAVALSRLVGEIDIQLDALDTCHSEAVARLTRLEHDLQAWPHTLRRARTHTRTPRARHAAHAAACAHAHRRVA